MSQNQDIDIKIFKSEEAGKALGEFLQWANGSKRKIVDVVGATSRKYKIAAHYLADEPDDGPEWKGEVVILEEGDFDRMNRHHRLWLLQNPGKIIFRTLCFSSFGYTTLVLYREGPCSS